MLSAAQQVYTWCKLILLLLYCCTGYSKGYLPGANVPTAGRDARNVPRQVYGRYCSYWCCRYDGRYNRERHSHIPGIYQHITDPPSPENELRVIATDRVNREAPPPSLSQSCGQIVHVPGACRSHLSCTEKQLSSSRGDRICELVPRSAALTSKQSGQLSAAARASTRANFALSMISAVEKKIYEVRPAVCCTPRLFRSSCLSCVGVRGSSCVRRNSTTK